MRMSLETVKNDMKKVVYKLKEDYKQVEYYWRKIIEACEQKKVAEFELYRQQLKLVIASFKATVDEAVKECKRLTEDVIKQMKRKDKKEE